MGGSQPRFGGATRGDFFEHDLHFGLFDTSNGYRPGQRVCVLEGIPVWLNHRQVPIDDSRPLQRLDGTYSWRALRHLDWYKVRSLQPKWDKPPLFSPSLRLNQKFEWNGSELTECKVKETAKNQHFFAANRLKVSVGGGRIPFGSSLLDSDKLNKGLDKGLGDCLYCDQDYSMLNVQHFFLCSGSQVEGMEAIHNRLKARRFRRYLAMLARFELQGFNYPIAPGLDPWKKSFESDMGAGAQSMAIAEFYERSAEEQSEEMVYNLSMRQYRQDMRTWRYCKTLREKMERDKSFYVPAHLRKQVSRQIDDPPEPPTKPTIAAITPNRDWAASWRTGPPTSRPSTCPGAS